MKKQKSACVVYVASTKDELPRVKEDLEKNGYLVCSVLATLEVSKSIHNGGMHLPDAVKICIESSELCVFLLPAEQNDDEGISGGVGLAGQLGKRIIGLVSGSRVVYPDGFEVAGSVLRITSERLSRAIEGDDVWETKDKAVIEDRAIDHQKCQ